MAAVLPAWVLLAPRTDAQERVRICGSGPRFQHLLETSQDFRVHLAIISSNSQTEYALLTTSVPKVLQTVTIPVAFHVLYNATGGTNLSDAQIRSQIDDLNRDYDPPAANAADPSKVPVRFANRFGVPHIRFQLATKDPQGQATAGILRTQTQKTTFLNDDNAKKRAAGGDDPWDRSRYLNLWSVPDLVDQETGAGLYGYSSFPGEEANVDGVVLWYKAVGHTGVLEPSYNLGRTATHEIGHWLALQHLWGSGLANANCKNDDNIADTPAQAKPHMSCPPGTVISCNNGPDGDMFMNFMNYVPDACMTMFTVGQVAVMRSTLDRSRTGLTKP